MQTIDLQLKYLKRLIRSSFILLWLLCIKKW